MNRIELATDDVAMPSSFSDPWSAVEARAEPRIRRAAETETVPLTTFAPIHYEGGYAYPLIVWLHGAGGNERQLSHVMPPLSMRNYVAVAPRGTSADDCQQRAFRWQQTTDDIEAAEARVADGIATARRRFHVHPRRIFLAGFGCGGTMALRVAWNHPDQFAGVATFNGPMPQQNRPLRHLNAIRRLPCFVAIGGRSREYPEPDVCRDLRMLHLAGCTAALRQYPCGDELTTVMLADLNDWIMSLVCAPQASL